MYPASLNAPALPSNNPPIRLCRPEKLNSLTCASVAPIYGVVLNGVLISELIDRVRYTDSSAKNATGVIVTPL